MKGGYMYINPGLMRTVLYTLPRLHSEVRHDCDLLVFLHVTTNSITKVKVILIENAYVVIKYVRHMYRLKLNIVNANYSGVQLALDLSCSYVLQNINWLIHLTDVISVHFSYLSFYILYVCMLCKHFHFSILRHNALLSELVSLSDKLY